MRSVFPRAARIWISNEHKLQPWRFTSHGKWEAVCAPGWALVHPSSPVLPPGRHSNVEAEQSVRPRSCVNDTHWAVFSSFCSCRALLGGSSVVIVLPPSCTVCHTQEISFCSLRQDTDLVSGTMPVCEQVKMSCFHSQVTMPTQWHIQGHHLRKKKALAKGRKF